MDFVNVITTYNGWDLTDKETWTPPIEPLRFIDLAKLAVESLKVKDEK